MNGITVILITIFVLVMWITIAALFHIIRTDIYDNKQKAIQCILVFVLPIIFPIIALAIIFSHYKQDPYSKNTVRVGFFLIDLIVLSVFVSNVSASSNDGVDVGANVGSSGDYGGGDH